MLMHIVKDLYSFFSNILPERHHRLDNQECPP